MAAANVQAFTVKGGGACPSMFSTPGFPARFAREEMHASGRIQVSGSAISRPSQLPGAADESAGMSSDRSNAAPSSSPEPTPEKTIRTGDERSRLQQLYRQHSSSLVRQLTRKTGCQELARELANETFLRLLRMPPGKLDCIEQPESFLRRVSTNLLRDWGRAAALRQRSEPTLRAAAEQQIDQVALLESRDTLGRLERAMAKLKPRTREIFLAHRIEGLTYVQIARRTGLSVKGVEKQMSKAIAKIDRLLDRD